MTLLKLPETHSQCYISGIPALNIISPDGTGDWHKVATFAAIENGLYPPENYLFGDGQRYSTNHLLGTAGVIDGKSRLAHMGYATVQDQVWIADHPRACVDYMFATVFQNGIVNQVLLDEWFPSYEDKKRVYDLLHMMAGRLTPSEQEILSQWMRINPLITF